MNLEHEIREHSWRRKFEADQRGLLAEWWRRLRRWWRQSV